MPRSRALHVNVDNGGNIRDMMHMKKMQNKFSDTRKILEISL